MIDNTIVPIISAPTGNLDAAAYAALEEAIDAHIAQAEKNHIIDLRGVDKVDARAMRTIIKINRKISGIGGALRVVIANPKALRYIKLTAMERVIGVYPTTEEALAGFETDDRVVPQTESQRDEAAGRT